MALSAGQVDAAQAKHKVHKPAAPHAASLPFPLGDVPPASAQFSAAAISGCPDPNPNLLGPGHFMDGCPLPAAGINLAAPLPPTLAALLGTDVAGKFQSIALGTGLSFSVSGPLTLNSAGGGGGSVTWPASNDIVVSNSSNSPVGLAPVNNGLVYATGGSPAYLAPAASSVPCWSVSSVLTACSGGTLQSLLGYLTANQTITVSGDGGGSGTTAITLTNTKVNGVVYPATPATNTVPAVTSSNQVTYVTGAGLAALSGFGTMLTQNASAVAITGGSLVGTTINGLSNTITNIGNASLANSSMTLAGHSVSLGGTQAFAIGDLSNIGASTIVGNNTGISGTPLALSTAQVSTMLGLGTLASQNSNALNVTGVTALTGLPSCANPTDACPKSYIDAAASGQPPHTPVAAVTAAVLPNTPTYANGSSGVGATLTAGANAALVIDGSTISTLGTRVLVSQQASGFQNGIYTLTTAGVGGSVPWQITRATDFNTAASGNIATGATVLSTGGSTLTNTSWSLSTTGTITVGTTALTFVQVGASNSYTADGSTLQLIGNQFSALPSGILSAITSTPNSLLARGTSTWAGVAPVNNAVLITSGSGAPSESTTLPAGLTIPGYLTANQTITLSGAVTGSGTTAITTTLASVADATLLANISGGSAAPSANTLTGIIDHDISSTRGALLERGATTWGGLNPGAVAGTVLTSNGAGADPSYQATGISGQASGKLAIGGSATTLTSNISFSTTTAANTIAEMGAGGLLDPGMLPLATAAAFGAVKCGSGITCTGGTITAAGGVTNTVSQNNNHPITAGESGTCFDNAGSTATVIFTLPTYSPGLNYCFIVMVANPLEVLAPAGVQIAMAPNITAAAGNVQDSTLYDTLYLVAPQGGTTVWVARSFTGTGWSQH